MTFDYPDLTGTPCWAQIQYSMMGGGMAESYCGSPALSTCGLCTDHLLAYRNCLNVVLTGELLAKTPPVPARGGPLARVRRESTRRT